MAVSEQHTVLGLFRGTSCNAEHKASLKTDLGKDVGIGKFSLWDCLLMEDVSGEISYRGSARTAL